MDWNPDFRDLFAALNAAGAKYLIIGGYAVIFHTQPRYTKDIDVLIDASAENAERVWQALATFGAPMDTIARSDLSNPEMVLQLGVVPNRIDILMEASGIEFGASWGRRVKSRYGDQDVWILDLEGLIENKRAAGRPQDLIDLQNLIKARSQDE